MEQNRETEAKVRQFYEAEGWKATGPEGASRDAALWEDLRPTSADYVRACRRRLLGHIPVSGERFIDAASGPIQYPEYLEYSWCYTKRICVDISLNALKQAQEKLGEAGEYLHASILDLPLPDNSIDAGVSLHTIYHIPAEQQEAAVRQLIRVIKPGKPLLVVYANPDRILARIKRWVTGKRPDPKAGPIYYHAHSLDWWQRFHDSCEVSILPWRSLTAKDMHFFFPGNFLGRWMLALVYRWERAFPNWAVNWGAYPLILLSKRKA